MFTTASLKTLWYVMAGNHDLLGNVSAQIEYSKISQRWKYPDYFYTFSLWQSNAQKKLVDFIVLDTVLLCAGENVSDWEYTSLKGPKIDFVAEVYCQWVEEQLRQSTAPYLLTSGHFPVYSVAKHGPTKRFVERLRPLLHQYRETVYMCGHDHNLQHLAEELHGTHTDYFVVGASNIVEDNLNHADDLPADSLKYFWDGAVLRDNFGLIEVNSTQITFSFIEH